MNTDEVIATPAADLPPSAVPLHVIVVIEYLEPASDDGVTRPRLQITTDDTLSAWNAYGMLTVAASEQLDSMDDIAPD